MAAVGLQDIVVISTKDAILVAHKDSAQNAKLIAFPSHLKTLGRSEWEKHREVYRPWGKFDSINHGERYQVKRITVNPGAKLLAVASSSGRALGDRFRGCEGD